MGLGEAGKTMSETRRVTVELRDKAALARAVAVMGGSILGEGSHKLFAGNEVGYGLQLAGWRYPIVLRADGTLAYDDYHGKWGKDTDIERLGSEYTMAVAESQAAAMGYYAERVSDALKVYFPGAELWVFADGRIDAVGFNGVGCDEAAAVFAGALGRTVTISHKAEYFNERARVAERGE
jgi:hypothetical protein